MQIYKSLAVARMKVMIAVIAILCLGLIVREIWAVCNVYQPILPPQDGSWYCGTPLFTGRNVWKDVLAILLTGASLLPIAIAPWLISRAVSFMPLPTEHQLGKLWWTIRVRKG